MKYCSGCGQTKPRSDFSPRTKGSKYVHVYCKPCSVKRTREYQIKNGKNVKSEWNRRYIYKKNYGVTLSEYDRMLIEQDGVCWICKKPQLERLAIDHNKMTGAIRALLCRPCNLGLGNFLDNPEALRRAAYYLERYE